ncbi:Uncharacterised protein [Mycobacterium tuberculosis]|uniref:Uncharacterized protein n=1 Tax=Mycobacterium tuberculosis TaxID=1773 RepID=A0A0T9FKN3_MYCTX|nr:Uncharacterised protein [Mycobacterium tuberculosis]CKP11530.1 Uncharacterised protein [Mycobacterium tuberculosis]CKS69629.1 Uncharacterised protein [Mycobacterium tuberculosis]CKU43642.1 Uncharacterised protein [Mycobacterium tuberculosis]CNV52391.1 Uncharacterised protein [Mycobacterium tuberculosis]
MIEQVAPDLGRVVNGVDVVFGEVVAVADAGEHQQLRAVDGTSAEHHLAAGVDDAGLTVALVFHADGPVAVDDHPGSSGAGKHTEVFTAHRGLQIGVGSTESSTAALGDDGLAKAFRSRGIRPRSGKSALTCGCQPRCGHRSWAALPGNMQRTGYSAVVTADKVPGSGDVLDAAKVAEHVGVRPPRTGSRGPLIVV